MKIYSRHKSSGCLSTFCTSFLFSASQPYALTVLTQQSCICSQPLRSVRNASWVGKDCDMKVRSDRPCHWVKDWPFHCPAIDGGVRSKDLFSAFAKAMIWLKPEESFLFSSRHQWRAIHREKINSMTLPVMDAFSFIPSFPTHKAFFMERSV